MPIPSETPVGLNGDARLYLRSTGNGDLVIEVIDGLGTGVTVSTTVDQMLQVTQGAAQVVRDAIAP